MTVDRDQAIQAAADLLIEETLHMVLPHEVPRFRAQAERIVDAILSLPDPELAAVRGHFEYARDRARKAEAELARLRAVVQDTLERFDLMPYFIAPTVDHALAVLRAALNPGSPDE